MKKTENRITKMRILILLLCVSLLSLVCAGCAGQTSGTDGYKEARNGVVVVSEDVALKGIYSDDGYTDLNGVEGKIATGSGFFVGQPGTDPQYLITNYHVVSDYMENGAGENTLNIDFTEQTIDILKCYIRVYFSNTDFVEAYVVDYNAAADVALLRLESPTGKRSALPLCSPDDTMIGSQAYAIGFPGVSDNSVIDPVTSWGLGDVTVTSGAISRLATTSGTGVKNIQIDINIDHGNSGGPLVNENGAVLGINTKGVDAVNYAVNIDEAITLLKLHDVDYVLDTGTEENGNVALIAGIAAAVVIVLVVLILVLTRKKKPTGTQNGKQGSSPQKQPSAMPMTPTAPPVVSGKASSYGDGKQAEDSGYRIQAVSGALEGRRFLIRKDAPLTLGRNAEQCNVAFPASTAGVSGTHCQVWFDSGAIYIKDMGSSHGTFLKSGVRLASGQAMRLQPGETFSLGSEKETFVLARKGRE